MPVYVYVLWCLLVAFYSFFSSFYILSFSLVVSGADVSHWLADNI